MSTETNPVAAMRAEIAQLFERVNARQDAFDKVLERMAQPASRMGADPRQLLQGRSVEEITAASLRANPFSGPVTDEYGLPLGRWRSPGKGIGMGPMLVDLAAATGHHDAIRFAQDGHAGATQRIKNFHKLQPGEPTHQKVALAESAGTIGGYTVPPQFNATLLRLAVESAFVYPRCTIVPMTSRSVTIPTLDMTTAPTAGRTAFLGGIVATWHEEAQTRDESEPTFRQIELVAHELSFYTKVSNTLLADSGIALDSLLTNLFSMAIAWAKDYYILRGDGVGKPLGVVQAPASYIWDRDTNGAFKLVDAANMLAHLLMYNNGEPLWVMSQTLIPSLIQMVNAGNFSVFISNAPGQSNMGGAAVPLTWNLLGYPIHFTEKVPVLGTRGDVGLYDFSKYYVGDRMEMQIDVSPHVGFLTNQMIWRIIARFDGQPWLNNTVTLADTSTTVSPFVVCDT